MIPEIATAAAGMKLRAGVILASSLTTIAVLLGVGYLGWHFGSSSVQADWDAEKSAQKAAVRDLETKQADVSRQSEQAHTAANNRIETVFKDRYVYITQKTTEAKNAPEKNSACVIPAHFVRVWDSANRAEPIPEASGQSDDSASGITLDDIAAQHDREAEQFHINAQRLSDLQHWVNEQVRISEEVSK